MAALAFILWLRSTTHECSTSPRSAGINCELGKNGWAALDATADGKSSSKEKAREESGDFGLRIPIPGDDAKPAPDTAKPAADEPAEETKVEDKAEDDAEE